MMKLDRKRVAERPERGNEMAAFTIKEMTRNRCVGWATPEQIVEMRKAGSEINFSKVAAGIYTKDLLDDKGNVNTAACAAAGIQPASVTLITVNDLPADFANGPKAALTKLATEWSTDKVKWTPDEVAHYLAINARLQDEANESVKRHRPVTDKALDRAKSTLTKMLRASGKSDADIAKALAALA